MNLRTALVLLVLLAGACSDAAPEPTSPDGVAAGSTTSSIPPTSAAPDAAPTTPGPISTEPAPDDGCADVVDASARRSDDGTVSFDVTVRSADTGDEKYADAWQVETLDGDVIGVRELLHPHVNEQPFTRSLGPIDIPEGVTEVRIAARDSVLGFCGDTLVLELPS